MTLHDPLSKALLAEIDRQVAAECRDIEAAGRREAAAILSDAHGAARIRVRDAIAAMRREGALQLRHAEAQRSTRLRMAEEARIGEMLRRACPQLIDVVVRRWQEAGSRKAWIEAVARVARERLVGGALTVEHPATFDDRDRSQFLAAAGETSGTVVFEACNEFAVGLRIRAAGALLDATPEALLGNRPMIESMLLAELAPADSSSAGATALGSAS